MTAPRFAQIGERRATKENAPSTMRDHCEIHETSCRATTSQLPVLSQTCGRFELRCAGGTTSGRVVVLVVGKGTCARLTSWADLRWTDELLEHKADKHRRELLEGFGVERGIEDWSAAWL